MGQGGEVPRKFFFSTVKKKRKAAILPVFPDVQVADGQVPHEALKEHVTFHFRALYAAKPTSHTWEQEWVARYGEFPVRVTAEQREKMEVPFTEDEVHQAL